MAKVKTGPKTKRKGGGIPAKAKAVSGLQQELDRSTAVIVTNPIRGSLTSWRISPDRSRWIWSATRAAREKS